MDWINKRSLLVVVALVLLSVARVAAQSRPNVILIIGDDISRDDIGAYGRNPFVKTPNLDRLAREGFLFHHFFVTSSSCSPSRTSLLTGRYPHNTGAPELHLPLPATQVYFPELLRQNGYFTALLGKWHEGRNTRRAYDTLVAGVPANGEGGEEQWISVLENRPKDKPFFLWLASFDAHRNWDDDSRFQHSPDSVLVPPTLVDAPSTRKDLAHYYNEIERLDFYVGRLYDALASAHLLDNTYIVFLGDNGRPFPGDKTRILDRGTNTPLIVRIPQQHVPAKSIDALVSGIDIAPTILDWTGVASSERVQGRSFASLLLSAKRDFRNYIFTEHNWHDYQAYERAVRTKDFLYIKNGLPALANQGPLDAVNSPSFKDLLTGQKENRLNHFQQDVFLAPRPSEELYDVRNDSLQQYNLAGKADYQRILKKLRSILYQWQSETKDDFPATLTPDWYDRWHGDSLSTKGVRGIAPGFQSGGESTLDKGPF
ncbi:MAG: sulfatase [Chitinophagaceae bacterium]